MKPIRIFAKPKPIEKVTKEALNRIADSIYNPKTRQYLNLCSGTLQNGPDPVCEARPMHCGLGELYFAVTGRQPEYDSVDESNVIEEVVSRSGFDNVTKKAREAIVKMKIPDDLRGTLLDANADFDPSFTFRGILDQIPSINDKGEDNTPDFKTRARNVAKALREAAKLLPT